MEENDNLGLWNRQSITDPKNTKEVSYGSRGFTAIDAYSQIYEATKEWGSMGSSWGIEKEDYRIIEEYCIYSADLYYPVDNKKCIIPISSDIRIYSGKTNYNNDWSKKVKTDALTKGLSFLGFNADIFLGQFGSNKYVKDEKIDNSVVVREANNIQTEKDLNAYFRAFSGQLSSKKYKELQEIYKRRIIEIKNTEKKMVLDMVNG